MRLPATSAATAFADGYSCSFLCDFIRGHACHALQHFPTWKHLHRLLGPCFSTPPLAPASRGNPPVRRRLSLPVVKRPLRIGARLAPAAPQDTLWRAVLNRNPELQHCGGDPLTQPALHTPTKSGGGSRAQIHKGTLLPDYPQHCGCHFFSSSSVHFSFFFFVSGGTMLSVGCIHERDWSLLVLWQQRGWLSDHVYVTRYLGRVTWERFGLAPAADSTFSFFQEQKRDLVPALRPSQRRVLVGKITLQM